jgi:hypothetical protein
LPFDRGHTPVDEIHVWHSRIVAVIALDAHVAIFWDAILLLPKMLLLAFHDNREDYF